MAQARFPARRLAVVGLLLAGAGLWILAPYLPAGYDIYVHLLWPQQVIRCLAQGQLPLWLPDLNAGFGSPGIRLYSPAGPFLVGVAGLLLGDVGRALRLAWLGALVALYLVARRWHRELPWWSGLLWVTSPAVYFVLFYRVASSELMAMPLSLWLLEAALAGKGSPRRQAWLWAVLWLLHVPSFIMTSGLVVLAALAHRPRGPSLLRHGLPVLGGLGLAAWHWLPLAFEKAAVNLEQGLTADIFDARRNFLFITQANDPTGVSRLEGMLVLWAAVAAYALLHDRSRALLALFCLALTTPLSYLLWTALPPLAYVQFPWRFLTPASLLMPAAILAFRIPIRWAAVVFFLVPYLWLPQPRLAPDPAFTGREGWVSLGEKIFQSVSGNPLVVDAIQNRPPSFATLSTHLQRFGKETLVSGPGPVAVKEWRPLRRVVAVEAQNRGFLEFRLLAYPYWRAQVDGKAVAPRLADGIVAVPILPGSHLVQVEWSGNPATVWGWALAWISLALLRFWPRSCTR